jgi:hypothetical protein
MASFYFILIVLVPWGRFSDVDQPRNTRKDPLHVPNGPMTRSKTKALKETLNALVLNVSTKSELKGPLEYQGPLGTSYPCARGVQYNLI